MANHCIDVVCLECGEHYCLRGCSPMHKLTQEKLEKVRAEHQKRPEFEYSATHCGKRVVDDSIIYRALATKEE